ncbi:MAG: hypothetical protein WCW87_00905 [Candidatus Paceibacterota bacterium]
MKEKIKSFISYLKGIFKKRDGTISIFGKDSSYDWEVLIILFAIINIFSVIMNLYFYKNLESQDIFASGEKESVQTSVFDRELLKKMDSVYESKNTAFDNFKDAPLRVIDPSI